VAEQESVSWIYVGISVRAARRAVERRHRGQVPAIDRIDEHTAVRLWPQRFQKMELGAVLDESCAIGRREIQVADRFVTRMSRVRSEMQDAREVFIWATRAEGFSGGKPPAGLDLYSCYWH